MSSRRNFLDADNSIMERNLRFVKNDLEENLNQYFGGSTGRGNNSNNVTAPPRDYKVVQPKPGSHAHGMEKRRGFLLELGLARHEAYEMAKNTNFDVNSYEEKCRRWLGNGLRKDEIANKILFDIRNQNNWNKNIVPTNEYPSNTSAATTGAANINRRYNDVEHDPHDRYQSGSRFRPNEPKTTGAANFNRRYNEVEDIPQNRNQLGSRFRPNEPTRSYQNEESHYASRSRSPFNEQRNEEYFLQRRRSRSFSPHKNQTRSRSRSPNRDFREKRDEEHFSKYDNYSVDERRDMFYEKSRSRPFSPTRGERYQQTRTNSPNRKSEGFNLNYDYTKDNLNQTSGSRFSNQGFDSRNERRPEDFSAQRNFEDDRERNMNFLNTFNEPSSSNLRFSNDTYKGSQAPQNERSQLYQSSGSGSFNKGFDSRYENRREDFSAHRNFEEGRARNINNSNSSNQPSSSNLRFSSQEMKNKNNVNPNQYQSTNKFPQKPNIPSLLSLQVFPNRNEVQKPSTSKNLNRQVQEHKLNQPDLKSNNVQKQQQHVQPTKSETKGKTRKFKKFPQSDPNLKPYISNIPMIPTGRKKPLPGHLKANPQYYWSQWWPQYKYIEYSLPDIDPNDNVIQKFLTFMCGTENQINQRKRVLLKLGVRKIMKTSQISEKNYYTHDIYKMFRYKKHLEDTKFQKSLSSKELNSIAPALRQFQIKPTLAFLHQALIVKWHTSLDIIMKVKLGEPIMSGHARSLLNDKCFHYLVKESIQELKEMCQQDWPEFNEFYEKLEAKKIDINELGVGPNMEVNANNEYGNEDDEEDEDDDNY